MTKNKKFAVIGLSAVMGIGLAAGISTKNISLKNNAEECTHTNVVHYDGVAPTETALGKNEHWACCDCGERWTDAAKTHSVTDASLMIAKKTSAVAINENAVKDEGMLLLNAAKLKCLEQTTREYYEIDGRVAAKFSANESLFASMDEKNYGASDFRFNLPTYQKVLGIEFEYKLWDINYEVKTETITFNDVDHNGQTSTTWKYNTKVHTTTYDPVYAEYVRDNQWHTQSIALNSLNIEYFQLMLYHFNGEMYVANVKFICDLSGAIIEENATPAADDMISNVVVLEKSIAAGASEDKKSIKNMTKTDAARYVKVKDMYGNDATAMYFAANMGDVTVADGSNNYGFAEFRIAGGTVNQATGSYEKKAIAALAFDYRYRDSNTEVNTLLGNTDKAYGMKSYVEYKNDSYANVTKPETHLLINDTQWHTCVVDVADAKFAAALVKIFAFNGELLVTNFHIYTEEELFTSDFLYRAPAFENYFTLGASAGGVKKATLNSKAKTMSIETKTLRFDANLLSRAKAAGFSSINLDMTVTPTSGEACASVPYVSDGSADWNSYWAQPSATANKVSIVLDLNRLDFTAHEDWSLRFSCRTAAGGANDQPATFEFTKFEFYKVTLDKAFKDTTAFSTYFTNTSNVNVDAATASATFTGPNNFVISETLLNDLRAAGATSVSFTFDPQTVQTKTLVTIFTYIPGATLSNQYPLSWAINNVGKINVTIDGDYLAQAKSITMISRDSKGYSGADVKMTSPVKISNFGFMTPSTQLTIDQRAYTSEAWTSTDTKVSYNPFVGEFIATGSWSIYLSTEFVATLIAEGYKTITLDVSLLDAEGHYVADNYGGSYNYHLNGGTFTYILSRIASSKLQIRACTAEAADWNDVCEGKTTIVRNIVLSKTIDPEVAKQESRESLSNITKSSSECWAFLRHNGWGTNTWGEDNTTINLSDNNNFMWNPDFVTTMKDAQYTKVTLTVAATKAEGANDIAGIKVYVGSGSSVLASIDSASGTLTVDLTTVFETYPDGTNVIYECFDSSNARVRASFVITNISFAE